MSRKRRKQLNAIKQQQHQQHQKNKEKKKAIVRKFTVPLSQWKRFEQFIQCFSTMEKTLSELQEDWNNHLNFLEDEFSFDECDLETMGVFNDNILKMIECFKCFDMQNRSYLAARPPHENMIAEVYIEEISDGNL